ncbi:MAG: hypothetical protein M3O86_06400 [Actinomycetota bacterium]|nr:hypothetical protein [Actinomycetota bacterium]
MTRYVVRITAGDVGRRVSVRSRTHAPPGEPGLTDTVGRLSTWTDGVLTIVRRDGTRADIDERDLVAGRILAEHPRRGDWPS